MNMPKIITGIAFATVLNPMIANASNDNIGAGLPEMKNASEEVEGYNVFGKVGTATNLSNRIWITSYHAVSNTNACHLENADGVKLTAFVIAVDRQADLALIKSKATGESHRLSYSFSGPLKGINDNIFSAVGRRNVCNENGNFESVVLNGKGGALIEGNSGSPIINQDGSIVGIVDYKNATDEIVGNGVVPAPYIEDLLKKKGIELSNENISTSFPQTLKVRCF